MEYLVDKYIKTPDYVKELFQEHVLVTLKIDGSAFQIFYNKDEDKIEYHKRGGSSSKLGPIIDEYTQLFTKHLNDAIDFFDSKKDILKKYKFYAIEIFNDMYVLLNVIDNNDKVVTDIYEIARELNIEPLPTLFGGKINFKDIEPLLLLDEKTTNKEFTDLLKNTFGPGDYLKFLNGDEVEGIVLTWIKDNKPLQYKIINPAFKTRHETDQKNKLEEAKKDTKQLNKLIELLYNKLKEVAKYRDSNWIKNLDLNFIEMCSDQSWLDDIKKVAKEITPNTNKWFNLQVNRVSNIISPLLDNNEMKIIYEKYLMTFNRPKKRTFIISKEFQNDVNNIIEKMQSIKESLHLFTKIHVKGLNNYITEKLQIGSNTKLGNNYNYCPKTRDELRDLVKKLIKERGNEANLNDIDVSKITNMHGMFYNSQFNGDISGWDVGNVTDMSCMFTDSKFNKDISKWDVSNVTDMSDMFSHSQFNGDIKDWDVSKVTNMCNMFYGCKTFNQNLDNWDVSNVTDMSWMFKDSKFNGNISKWNINKDANMMYIFDNSPLEKNPPKWYKK